MTALRHHHLRLFGIPELLDPDRQPVRLRTRKQLALLVYLAIEARDRPATRDLLIELFWPDAPRKRGRHSLSQALTAIRAQLGRDALSRSSFAVRLLGGLATDLDSSAADGLAPADLSNPLREIETCAGASFAHWVDFARLRCLEEMRVRLLAELTAARANGQVKAVHERAALLYAIDPHCDTAAQALAERYLLQGDSAGAVRLLRRHIVRSEVELGRSPPPEMRRSIRRLEGGVVQVASKDAVEGSSDPEGMSPPEVFVGRESDLSELEALWTRARQGRLVTCMIRGPVGIGKSSLLRRFATSLTARAWPVYIVGCQEMGRSIPFAAVADLIYQLTRDPALSGTDPHWLAEASRVTPGLRAIYPGIPEPPSTPAEAVRLRVAEAIFRMLEVVGDGGPMLLAFDDVQHIDPASRHVLHVLLRRLEATATLLLATIQHNESECMLGELDGAEGIDWQKGLYLQPLDSARTHELIDGLLRQSENIAEPVRATVAALSQGNPYLTEILISDWRQNAADSLIVVEACGNMATATWHPPETMRLAFGRQYRGLSKNAQHVLHLLSVAARTMPTSEITAILTIKLARTNQAALELIDRGIVRMERGALGFKNELHRAFVYSAMSHEARIYHHARLAQTLTNLREAQDFQRALNASYHFIKAEMIDEAVEAVSVGADLAVTRGAPKEAERALQALRPKCPDHAKRQVAILLARALSAQQLYRETLKTLPVTVPLSPDAEEVAVVAHLRAEALHRGRLADEEAIVSAATEATSAARRVGNERLIVAAQQVVAEVAYDNVRWESVRDAEKTCAEIEQSTNDREVRALALLTLGYCRLISGEFAGAAELFADSARQLHALNLDIQLYRALNGSGICCTNLGHFDKALKVFRKAMSTARRSGDTVAQANASANLGSLYGDLGLFAEAAESFRLAILLNMNASTSRVSTAIFCNAASLSMILGNFAESQELLETAHTAAQQSQLWQHLVSILLTRADLHLATGEPELAWPLVEEALSRTGDRHHLVPDLGQYWRLLKHYHWASGQRPPPNKRVAVSMPSTSLRLAHWLEVQAFEAWIDRGDDLETSDTGIATDLLIKHRLFGVVARLAAVRVLLKPIPQPFVQESSAQLVARAFPNSVPTEIPTAVRESTIGTP